MPKTKFQDIIFSILMAFAMVYAMELYNLALENGGLENSLFLNVFQDLLLMGLFVILLEKLIGGRIARKLALRLVNPETDRPIIVTLTIQCFTVLLMCPMMSMVATIMFKQPHEQIIAIWLQTFVLNFPVALLWQIFIAEPVVRFIFRRLFNKTIAVDTIESRA